MGDGSSDAEAHGLRSLQVTYDLATTNHPPCPFWCSITPRVVMKRLQHAGRHLREVGGPQSV